jgi:hypothetical protein
MNSERPEQPPLALKVGADGRYLECAATAMPFLWIGDTAWELFHRLDREEALHYLDRRAAQGFSVIQAVVLAESDGLRTPNAYGHAPLVDCDPARPNERYFEHVDFIVRAANERGLFVALLPTWGDKVPNLAGGIGPVVFDATNARHYGRFLGKRYRDTGVVWMLGGDRGIDTPTVLEIWRAMALGIREGDGGRHPMTFHPRGDASSGWWVHNEPWLDFNVFQSGHVARYLPVHRFAEELALMRPRKPFLDAEPPYEDIPVRFWNYLKPHSPEPVPPRVLDRNGFLADTTHFRDGFFTDYDVRVHAYRNLLAGSCGHTYGNNAVWQMWRPGQPAAIPCLHDWRTALDRPGANQIRHLRALFTRFPFDQLVPDQSLVFGPNGDGPDHVRAAISEDRTFALAYLARARPLTMATRKLTDAPLSASWFDPRTGRTLPDRDLAQGGHASFEPPASDPGLDWVLILQSASPAPEASQHRPAAAEPAATPPMTKAADDIVVR